MGLWTYLRFQLFLMAGGQQLMSLQAQQVRAWNERVWATHVATELMGLSFLSTPDALRLLPYVVPVLMTWRRQRQSTDTVWEEAACLTC